VRMKHIVLALTMTLFVSTGCDRVSSMLADSKSAEEDQVLTAEMLEEIPDEELEVALFDHGLVMVNNSKNSEYETVMALPRGVRMVYTTWLAEAEVNNGGFNQYFWNSAGQFAHEALQDFELISATGHAALMKRAIAIAKREQATMEKYRKENTLEAFSESYKHTELNGLDDEFYDLEEDLSALRIKYIREHPQSVVSN
jgi:hypothetical protein